MPQEQILDEQILEALNAHWQASAAGDADAEHDIYDDDAICDYPQSGERIFGRKQSAGLAKPSSRQAVRLSSQANSRKRRSLDHRIHDHLPGKTSLHSEHYGVPQRQGRARDPIFRRPLRRAGLAQPMGSADCILVTDQSNNARTGLYKLAGRVGPPVRPAHYLRIAGYLARTLLPLTQAKAHTLSPIEGGKECGRGVIGLFAATVVTAGGIPTTGDDRRSLC